MTGVLERALTHDELAEVLALSVAVTEYLIEGATPDVAVAAAINATVALVGIIMRISPSEDGMTEAVGHLQKILGELRWRERVH
jgi:hypothetical protein